MNELIKEKNIKDMIYEMRGVQVMLDSDLARLYHCKNGTKAINQAVHRNEERFPNDFCFQLTHSEFQNLKSQIVTSSSNNNYGGVRKLPYVFTEQGVAMLATVIKTEVAAQESIKIMRAFVLMRKHFNTTLLEQKHINNLVLDHDNRIELLEESFDKLEEKKKENDIYFAGQIYDAYSKILEIFKEAKEELIIIDSYADKNLLDIIKNINVKVTIITKENNLLSKQDIEKYNKQYSNLKVIYDNSFHDRFFIIDKKTIYHCGTSINSIGKKTFAVNLFKNEMMIKALIENIQDIV